MPDVTFSAVLPTYNRAAALRENLPNYLALQGLAELVVVDDGSSDETSEVLAAVADRRLTVLTHATNSGSPAARRTGIAAASGSWLLMLEDDVQVPRDFGQVLLAVAIRHGAAVVGAPWVHAEVDQLDTVVLERRARAVTRVDLRTHPGQFPTGTVETPFLPGVVMVHCTVFACANYDPGYRGNAWREETSFFMAVQEAGMTCVLTPDTYSFQNARWSGGQPRSPLRYELWVARNNWRFLRRHRHRLVQQRYIPGGIVAEQARFLACRAQPLVRGKLRSVLPVNSPCSPAHVVVLSAGSDTTAGGVERFTDLLGRALRADGLAVSIVVPTRQPPRLASRTGAAFLHASWTAAQAARRLDADLYIGNGTLGSGLPTSGVRRVHVLHGTMPAAMRATATLPRRERLRAAVGGGLAEALAGRGAVQVAVSRSAAAEAERYYGTRVPHVIENGVDTAVFRPRDRLEARRRLGLPARGRLALFVGRAEPRKSPEVARAAAAAAGFDLAVAGARPIDGTRHLGSLSPDQLAWAYAAADCLLMPTRYEACSYAVLEAMAVGTPVVTTAVGWVPDLLQAVPAYGSLVVHRPEPRQVAAVLGRIGGSGVAAAVGQARRHVLLHNAEEAFARSWRDLVHGQLAAPSARAAATGSQAGR